MTDIHQVPQSSAHKDQRRQQLIDATIATISKYGLSKTTISKVTGEARLSAGIVGFYFDSKEKLLLGTLRALQDELRNYTAAVIEKSDPPLATLKAIIDLYFEPTLCDPNKIAVWYAFSSESSARKEYMDICGEHDAWFQKFLFTQCQLLCTTKDGNTAGNAVAISRGLDGLIDGFWQECLYQPEDFDRESARTICYEYLDTVFPPQTEPGNIPETTSHGIAMGEELSDCLPTWAYYDPELLELEKEVIFRRNWLLIGHVNDIPNARDYLTLDAVGERALVVRGTDNKIRGFHNVCRHRGAKLLDASSGNCAHALTCPFHGWTYQLDGQLIGVPAENTFANLDKSTSGLVSLDLEIWMGFIFIRFDGDGPSLAKLMKPVEKEIEVYNLDQMLPLENTRSDELHPYNWKTFHDIDNEGYHVPIGHPSLQQLYGKNYKDEIVEGVPVSYGYLNEKPAKLWSVRNYQKLLPEFDHLPADKQRLWLYETIFPSMVLGLYPDCIEFYMTMPVATDQTLVRSGVYALPDNRPEMKALRYLNRRINDLTSQEDESYVRGLQDGMQSRVFPEPNLSSIEQGVREFHHQLQQILPVARLKNHPGSGRVENMNRKLLSNTRGNRHSH
jgi:phenylpropionate dioxygenase-like ring-hydroxylating dioxygenase large terminal subunit/AcrR family transcriptional regulator